MGYLHLGTDPRRGNIPHVAIPHLSPLKTAPSHGLAADSRSSALVPGSPAVYSPNFSLLRSASSEFLPHPCHPPPPDCWPTSGDPHLMERRSMEAAHSAAQTGRLWAPPHEEPLPIQGSPRFSGHFLGLSLRGATPVLLGEPTTSVEVGAQGGSEAPRGTQVGALAGGGEPFPLLLIRGTLPSSFLFSALWGSRPRTPQSSEGAARVAPCVL